MGGVLLSGAVSCPIEQRPRSFPTPQGGPGLRRNLTDRDRFRILILVLLPVKGSAARGVSKDGAPTLLPTGKG